MRLVTRPDWIWLEARALEGLCDIASANGLAGADRWLNDLVSQAGRTGIRELLLRAYLYKARLGDRFAHEAAVAVASDIDNPYLEKMLESEAARVPA